MADSKVQFTHEQDLGPGVTRTPGYVVEDSPALSGIGDRRVDKDGVPAGHPILSTYAGPQNGLAAGPDSKGPKPVVAPGDTVAEANAAVAGDAGAPAKGK